MRRMFAGVFVLLALAGGLRVPGLPWWGLMLLIACAGALAWRLSLCPHPGPLALLPATRDLDGTPLPARWYCDTCGQTWAANFEKDQTPVRRFTGYDESKAVHAAKRAAELADRQRALALQRAGLRPAARKSRPVREAVPVAETAGAVVPIGQSRRFAG